MRRVGPSLLALTLSLTSLAALAEVGLRSGPSSSRVEVGAPFTVTLHASLDGGEQVSSPSLAVPPGVVARGPSVSTQSSISMVPGQMRRTVELSITWTLVAPRAGQLKLGPASIVVDGRRLTDRSITVQIVPEGSVPAPRSRNRSRTGSAFDPFAAMDPFGGGDPFSGPMFPPGLAQQLGLLTPPGDPLDDVVRNWPEELNIDRPLDRTAFVDARFGPRKVVVGQQVTLGIYAYARPSPFEIAGGTDPSREDFLSYDLSEGTRTSEHQLLIGREAWYAGKIRQFALFPLRAGRLRVGPMQVTFQGHEKVGKGAYRELKRQSRPLDILVEEPPLNGRPAGYRVGDVGDFKLTAQVEPRSLQQGEAISVRIELNGTGQPPERILLPELPQLDWLPPTLSEDIHRKHEKIGGKRVFQYVVRVLGSGQLELGKVRLPFWNPATNHYEMAEAALGTVEARPSAKPPPPQSSTPSETPLPAARGALRPYQPAALPLTERRGFFLWLLLGPSAVLSYAALRRGLPRLARWSRQRALGPTQRVAAEILAARQSLSSGEGGSAASHLERAIHLAMSSYLKLESRALLRPALAKQLSELGVSGELSAELLAILEAADGLRFTGGGTSDVASLIQRTVRLCDGLRASRSRRGAQS